MSTVPAAAARTPLERIDLALACLATDHRIGGVLFVGLPPELLPDLGHRLGMMLADDGQHDAETVILGTTRDEDSLWWIPQLTASGAGFQFEMVPGPLVDLPGGPPRAVLIPDLATASLAVTRAAVTLISANHATADRHGQHASWRPKARWLAACSRSALTRLSPHLLDRFCVRVDVPEIQITDRHINHEIMTAIHHDGTGDRIPLAFPEPRVVGQWRAAPPFPRMTPEALEAVLSALHGTQPGVRRELALARLARAIAVVQESGSVHKTHVREAVSLITPVSSVQADDSGSAGLGEDVFHPAPPSPSKPEDRRTPQENDGSSSPAASAADEADISNSTRSEVPAGETSGPVLLDPATPGVLSQGLAYPEDTPGAIAEYASLQEQWQRTSQRQATHGHVIGSEPTQNLTDLAIVPTVFEAAKFRLLRQSGSPNAGPQALITRSDLRRYRYQPRPDTGIVLVLDHTSHREWDFASALAPYLRWAYVQHAALSVVELGYHGAVNELRASAYRASSVLDGRISASLSRAPGRATPLAHALEIAVHELRRYVRQAEVVAGNSWFIVVSDGRGNVPMESSHRGRLQAPVTREGVTDALDAAHAVRAVPRVNKIVIAPPKLAYYARLPFDLADAMGGIVAEGS